MAGKRKGTEDERHLWPEMLRVIREVRPSWVVGENVFGLTNWDGGLVFNEVQADLEAEGYEVQPYVLPACAVNAPHRRDRVWFVSRLITNSGRSGCDGDSKLKEWRNGERERISQHESDALCSIGVTPDSRLFGQERSGEQTAGVEQCNKGGVTADTEFITNTTRKQGEQLQFKQSNNSEQEQGKFGRIRRKSRYGIVGNTTSARLQGYVWQESRLLTESTRGWITSDTRCSEWKNRIHGEESERQTAKFGDSYTKFGRFANFPTVEPTICGGNDGLPHKLDGITFPRWRNESIKAMGNAIVPQVVYQIFKAIEQYERLNP